jgi:hypothetical protein
MQAITAEHLAEMKKSCAFMLALYEIIEPIFVCLVSEEELKMIHRRFRRLDTTKTGRCFGISFVFTFFISLGSLSLDQFLAIPELEHNPLVTLTSL